MEEKRKTLSARLARWAAELVLVFIGVYAAFWLNGYQQHQQEANRRDQILASLERILRQGIESGKINAADEEQQAAEFQRPLEAGEMPPLHPFVFTTDYNPGDFAALLQAGGIELLDVETLTALRNDESVIRWGLSRMAHYQKLSDELIVPNLDQDLFLLRSDDQEIAKTFRDVSRSSASKSEIRSRPGSNAHRTAETHSSGTAALSQRSEIRDQRSEVRRDIEDRNKEMWFPNFRHPPST